MFDRKRFNLGIDGLTDRLPDRETMNKIMRNISGNRLGIDHVYLGDLIAKIRNLPIIRGIAGLDEEDEE